MARWLIVRHGETEWNRAGKMQGHTDIGLSGAGRAQVTSLRERLRAVKFDAAYTSDLARAADTAGTLLQGRPFQAIPTAQLRELSYGDWEGLTWQEIQERDPEQYDWWVRVDPNFQPPEGESLHALMERAGAFVEEVNARHVEGTILVVAHGGSIRALALTLLGISPDLFRRFSNVAPASLSIIHVFNGTAILESWNDTAHYRGLA